MKAVTFKIIGVLISLFTTCAFADTKLPKCVIYTFGNCVGMLKYPNGDVYSGEFNFGQPNGSGKMTYSTGDLYIGSFHEGQKHGIGDYTWADGNRYVGQFVEGNLEGRGAYYFLAKNKTNPDKYIGYFKKNVFNGDGVYTFGNGAVVSGKFKDGKRVEEMAAIAIAEVPKISDSIKVKDDSSKSAAKGSIEKPTDSPKSDSVLRVEPWPPSEPDEYTTKNKSYNKLSDETEKKSQTGKIFLSGSLNSIGLTAVNIVNTAGQRVADTKLSGSMRNIPFSLGLGYNLGQNYGVELGFKYHGDTKPDGYLADQDSLISSSFLLGGFLDIPISSGLELGLKGGFQNTDSTYEVFGHLPNGTITSKYTFTSNNTSYYYGIGLSYAVDGSNKVFIDWARFRSTFPNIGPSLYPVSAEVNTDITQFGIRHSF